MMGNIKFCGHCGTEIQSLDRFCGNCGVDVRTMATADTFEKTQESPVVPLTPVVNTSTPEYQKSIVNSGDNNKRALIVFTVMLAVVLLGGSGFYWWLAHVETQNMVAASGAPQTTGQEQKPQTVAASIDLSRAETYLPAPNLRCEFFANHPDGTSGNVTRISGHVAASRAIRVSEVEIGERDGREFGYGFHYLQRPDGIYYIYDQTPTEAVPALKNNLTVGQTWQQKNQFGLVVWRVLAVGASVDLGFTSLKDCVVVEEDNQAVGERIITYYAPGLGRVLVKSPGGTEFFKLTAYHKIDNIEASNTVKKWSPNYTEIRADRILN